MDPYQRLVDFSKLLSGDRNELKDEEIITSLEQLKIHKRKASSAAETSTALRQISDMREIDSILSSHFDPKDVRAISIRLDPAMIRQDTMARKQYMIDKFRQAAFRCMKRRRKTEAAMDPYARFIRKANITVIPTKTTSAVYLNKVFKYVVKRTILQHRKDVGGDPWDEFFYSAYGINKESMRLEFSAEEIAARGQEQPEQTARMAKVSTNLLKGEQRNRIPHMAALVGGPPEKDEVLRKKRIPKTEIPVTSHPRFRLGKVPHSPDGRTSLTRMFYLPLLDHSDHVG